MKKILLSIAILFAAVCGYTQGLDGINYQAVARNLNGTVVNNKPVQIRFTITQGNTATVQYKEIHTTNTNNFGLFNLVIGKGVPLTGTFSKIPFANANQWLEVEVAVAGGAMSRLGKSAFNAVPYALMAAAANPVGAAGGDLAGTYPNPTVAKLQGKAVSNTAPLAGQALVYNGTTKQWEPTSAIGGSNLWTKAGTTLYNTILTDNVSIGVSNNQAKLVVSGNGSSLFSDYFFGDVHASIVAVDTITNNNNEVNIGSVSIAANSKNWINIGALNSVSPNTDATDEASGIGTYSYAEGKGFMTGAYNQVRTENGGAFSSVNVASASGDGEVVGSYNDVDASGKGSATGTTISSRNYGNGDAYGVTAQATSFSTGEVIGSDIAGVNYARGKGGKVTGGRFTVMSGADATGLISGIKTSVRAANTNNYVQGLQLFTSKTGSNEFDVTGANIQTTNWDNDKPLGVLGVYSKVNTGQLSNLNYWDSYQPANPAGYFESNGGQGVYAKATTGAKAFGFYGISTGVTGSATTEDADNNKMNIGVSGIASKGQWASCGVLGEVETIDTPDDPFTVGIYGSNFNTNPSSYAGYFYGKVYAAGSLEVADNAKVSGNIHADGNISVGGMKNFVIDHPLDPKNKTLTHACIESNEVLNMYSGNIVTDAAGIAIVKLPDYFEALNKDFRYQLTVIGSFAQAIVLKEISNNQFVLKTNRRNIKVSWLVQGVRNDKYMQQNPMQVEQDKVALEKGKYIYPQGFGAVKETVKRPDLMNMRNSKKMERPAATNIAPNKMKILMEEKEIIMPKHRDINSRFKKSK